SNTAPSESRSILKVESVLGQSFDTTQTQTQPRAGAALLPLPLPGKDQQSTGGRGTYTVAVAPPSGMPVMSSVFPEHQRLHHHTHHHHHHHPASRPPQPLAPYPHQHPARPGSPSAALPPIQLSAELSDPVSPSQPFLITSPPPNRHQQQQQQQQQHRHQHQHQHKQQQHQHQQPPGPPPMSSDDQQRGQQQQQQQRQQQDHDRDRLPPQTHHRLPQSPVAITSSDKSSDPSPPSLPDLPGPPIPPQPPGGVLPKIRTPSTSALDNGRVYRHVDPPVDSRCRTATDTGADVWFWGQGERDSVLDLERCPLSARSLMRWWGLLQDRRPITPPPCVRLIVKDSATNKEVDVSEIEISYFVLTVDLWSPDATREVNLVRHSASATSIAGSIPTSYPTAMPAPLTANLIAFHTPQGYGQQYAYGQSRAPPSYHEQAQGYHHAQGQPPPPPPHLMYHQAPSPTHQYHQHHPQQPPYPYHHPQPHDYPHPHHHHQSPGAPPPPNGYSFAHPQQHYYSQHHPPPPPPPPPPPYHAGPPVSQMPSADYFHPNLPSAHGPQAPAPTGMFTRNLIGSLSATAFRLTDPDDKIGVWFVLQDLSVRTEGQFRLKMNFVNVGDGNQLNTGSAPVLASTFSDIFQVFSAKKFPGVIESTPLSKCFATQGIKIPIRKDGLRSIANREEYDGDD
ncbi:MAG: hypothetical protein M1815_004935, partial [Lichina confinis]